MDAKLDDDDDLIWLEANPQGAFLFMEALADIDVTSALCDFLLERAAISGASGCPVDAANSPLEQVVLSSSV